jgi:hypothetical protein
MTNQKLIERLKNVRVFVTDKQESKKVQDLAFSMGIAWGSGEMKYIDWECGRTVNNIIFRKRGEKLAMLRACATNGDRITIEELEVLAAEFKKESRVACDITDPEWTPKVGDKVRCIKPDGFLSDSKNYLLSSGIKVGEEYTVSGFTGTYAGYGKGLKLEGYPCTHPLSSFEPVKAEKITFDIETSGPIRILPTTDGVGKSSFGHVHFMDHMDHWQDLFIKSSGIPADRFGTHEHSITTSSWEGIGRISTLVGMDPTKTRWASPDHVVVPGVSKARKMNLERVEIGIPQHINVPYVGKTTKRIPEIKITKSEVYAYYTI